MAKATSTLSWCNVRLGEDHNWWVAETSDPVRWDVDGLSIIDPRQVTHLIELVDSLRDYGFDQDMFDAAFIPFRIEKDLGNGKVRLTRGSDAIVESNDLFKFESKLSVDEVEDEIREDQNSHFIEGKAVHTFEELTAILDFMPAGYDADDEAPAKSAEDEADDADLPEIDDAEEEKLKNDESLKWDEDEEEGDEDDADGKKKSDGDDEDSDDDEDGGKKAKVDDDEEDEAPKKPARGSKKK